MQKPTVSIIGLGSLGSSLALSLHHAGYRIEGLFIRPESSLAFLPEKLKKEVYHTDKASVINSDLIFICVKDDQISEAVHRLSEMVLSKEPIVIHCSGVLPSTELSGLSASGEIASFHPNKSFSGNPSSQAFRHVYVDIESESDAAFQILAEVAENLGATPFRLNADQKMKLHTAASMISNLTVALADAALSLAEGSQSRDALLELLSQTISSLRAKGSKEALTGPVARGDIKTVEQHLKVLEQDDNLNQIYRLLSLRALQMAENRGRMEEKLAEQIRNILS